MKKTVGWALTIVIAAVIAIRAPQNAAPASSRLGSRDHASLNANPEPEAAGDVGPHLAGFFRLGGFVLRISDYGPDMDRTGIELVSIRERRRWAGFFFDDSQSLRLAEIESPRVLPVARFKITALSYTGVTIQLESGPSPSVWMPNGLLYFARFDPVPYLIGHGTSLDERAVPAIRQRDRRHGVIYFRESTCQPRIVAREVAIDTKTLSAMFSISNLILDMPITDDRLPPCSDDLAVSVPPRASAAPGSAAR